MQPAYWRVFKGDLESGVFYPKQWVLASRNHVRQRFGLRQDSIAKVLLYTPTNRALEKDPVAFFVLHGTWARQAREFFGRDNKNFALIKRCAAQLAHRLDRSIELVSFRWSGNESFDDRYRAGKLFARLCSLYYGPANSYAGMYGWAHSHGCNIMNIASHFVPFKMDTLFYLASPIVEHSEGFYRPRNIKALYNFYSLSDMVQYAGSINKRSLSTILASSPSIRRYEQTEEARVVNLSVLINGKTPGHASIKNISPDLWTLVDAVESDFPYYHSFDVNFSYDKKNVDISVMIREEREIDSLLEQILTDSNSKRALEELVIQREQSRLNKDGFKSRYGHPVSDAGSLYEFFLSALNDLIAFVPDHDDYI